MTKYHCNKEFAIKTAVSLAEENIKSTATWVSPEMVVDFIEEVFNYLTAEPEEP